MSEIVTDPTEDRTLLDELYDLVVGSRPLLKYGDHNSMWTQLKRLDVTDGVEMSSEDFAKLWDYLTPMHRYGPEDSLMFCGVPVHRR